MRFGLFYEHQLPRPWEAGDEQRMMAQALEQVELADELGLDHVWEVEHHFLEEYSHSSAPEVFLAAASQRTSDIRLGHGIVQAPPTVNHPARIAERTATLDLISGGRVDLGTGEGSSQVELGAFGVDRDDKRDQWEEALDVIVRMMTEEPFTGHAGRWVDVPPRNVVPKPVQQPHPPLWMACSRRETIEEAARRGLGALSFSFVEPEEAKPFVDAYYDILTSEQCVPAGKAVNPNVAVVVPFLCHEDEDTAIQRGIDGAHFFGYSLAHYYLFGDHQPGRTSVWDEFQAYRDERGFAREIIAGDAEPLGLRVVEGGIGSLRGAVGTPDQIRDLIRRYEQAGVDQVILIAQAGDNRHEHVCESLELFADRVLPEFAAERDDVEAAKRDRLGGAVEAAVGRRPPTDRGAGRYVVSPDGELDPAPTVQPVHGRRDRGLGERAESGARRVLAGIVTRLDDGRLERWAGSRVGMATMFRVMPTLLDDDVVGDLDAAMQFVLTAADGTRHRWVLEIRPAGVDVRRGAAATPTVTLRAPLAEFVRIAAGERPVGPALMTERITLEGDLSAAARLMPALGADSPY